MEVVEEVVGVQGVVVEEQQPLGARRGWRRSGCPRSGSGPSRCARGTPRRCTGSRGSTDRRREPGRSRRSTPAPGRRGSRRARARGRGCSRGVVSPSVIRKPRVGPRWLTASVWIVAEPICHSLGGVSRKETEQGSSRTSTGDSGSGDVAGDPVLERGLRRGRPPDRDLHVGAEAGREEHQALDVVEVQVGEQDVDLRCAWPGRGPGVRIPVPASRIRSSPLSSASCTHEVFPP